MNDDVVGRVVAWHNRHPLAMRIEPRHVQGIGWVSLPYAGPPPAEADAPDAAPPAPPGGSLRERAKAGSAARRPASASSKPVATRTADRAFVDRFIEPWRPRSVAAFGARHGRLGGPVDADQPLRDVPVDRTLQVTTGIVRRYLRTAAVEIGARRVRVLLAPDDGALWGPRILDRARLSVSAGIVVTLAAAAVAVLGSLDPGFEVAPPAAPAASAALAKPVVVTASTAVSSPVATPASEPEVAPPPPTPTPTPPTAPMAPIETATATAPPASEAASAARLVPAIDIRPRLTPEETAQARREAEAMRAAARASDPAALPVPAPASSQAAPLPSLPSRAQDPAPGGRSFALVARPTRSRVASEVMLGLMKGAYAVAPGRNVEVLPIGDQWRATWWPFATRRDAELAQARLAELGVTVEVVEF